MVQVSSHGVDDSWVSVGHGGVSSDSKRISGTAVVLIAILIGGDFMAFVPGVKKQQTFPSTIAAFWAVYAAGIGAYGLTRELKWSRPLAGGVFGFSVAVSVIAVILVVRLADAFRMFDVVYIPADRNTEILGWLKTDAAQKYDLLVDLTAVDFGGGRPLEVVYQLWSIPHKRALRLKALLPLAGVRFVARGFFMTCARAVV